MKILEALEASSNFKVRRRGWGKHVHATFFNGTRGKRVEIENTHIGMEYDPTLADWFADDWEPLTEGE